LPTYHRRVTDVKGLHLAYRGFVSGLAAAYVWAAIAMTLAGLIHGDPLLPLRPIALAITPLAGPPELAFVIGLAAVQAAGALIGMCFAYFFARFFTVRSTMRVAGPATAILAWGLVSAVLARGGPGVSMDAQALAVMATIGYGLLLGTTVPVRGDVIRYSTSPST
jgi:hypothetical protein